MHHVGMNNDRRSIPDLLLRTSSDRLLLLSRVALGAIILPHGAQKLLGWFGGYGFTGTMGFFVDTMHLPRPLAFLVIMAESVGALALMFGLLSRITASGIVAVMVGAIVTTHLPNGFFMNWFGAQKGEGFEYHLLVIALAAPIILRGGGLAAMDTWLHAVLGRSTAHVSAAPPGVPVERA